MVLTIDPFIHQSLGLFDFLPFSMCESRLCVFRFWVMDEARGAEPGACLHLLHEIRCWVEMYDYDPLSFQNDFGTGQCKVCTRCSTALFLAQCIIMMALGRAGSSWQAVQMMHDQCSQTFCSVHKIIIMGGAVQLKFICVAFGFLVFSLQDMKELPTILLQ